MTPVIRDATGLMGWLLRSSGYVGMVSPWRTIYVLPEMRSEAWLIRHEVAHLGQMDRDGWFKFWIGIVLAYVYFGYDLSPYEMEARAAEVMPEHSLLKGYVLPC